jgi:toxin ParE1/3/4
VPARLRVRKRARADLSDIGRYTRQRWGRDQSHRYLGELDACFHRLLSTPTLGRIYAPLPPYWRVEQRSHVVFFRREANGDVVIVRVLHERMLPELHLGKRRDDDRD